MAKRERGCARESGRIRFRIGINLGDVIVEELRHLRRRGERSAARLEALAEPGGICLSRVGA